MSRWSLLMVKSVGQMSNLFNYIWEGGISVLQTFIFYLEVPSLVKPEGTLELHSVYNVRPSVRQSVRHTRFPDFSLLFFHISGWKLVASLNIKSYRPSSTFFTVDLPFRELLPFVRHTRFPEFSLLCFNISEWKLVASFHMKSYRSRTTFVTVNLIFREWLPFVQNWFSGRFSHMLTYNRLKVGSKLLCKELQWKFDFHHSWPPLLLFVCNWFSRLFLCYAFNKL